MTNLLQQAFAKAAGLPDDEQEQFARWLMDELQSERRWTRSFETSPEQLVDLAQEAIREDLAGRTESLDPERP